MGVIAKTVCDNYEDAELRNSFCELVVQLVVEQPFKTPFVAAVVLVVNTLNSELAADVLARAAQKANEGIRRGEWREVKLLMKFLGGLQGLLEGDGIFSVLQDLLTKAVDLQTENNEEVRSGFVEHRGIAANDDMNRLLDQSLSRSSSSRFRTSCHLQQQTSKRRPTAYWRILISLLRNRTSCSH